MENEYMKSAFDREISQAIKGIAVMMLLLHHTFALRSYYEGYIISFFPFAETQINNMGWSCKICVSIFAFISGYGLFLNFGNHNGKLSHWCLRRYIRTFSGYWFVWLTSAIICQLLNGYTAQVFLKNGFYNGLIYAFLDFLGVGMIFMTPRLIGPAWYMGLVVIFIIILPQIYKAKNELWLFLAMHVVFLRVILAYDGSLVNVGFTTIYPFITPFLLGCIFAEYRLIDRWVNIGSSKRWIKAYKFFAEVWLIIFGYKLYQNTPWNTFWDYHFGLYPVMVISFCVEFVVSISVLGPILRFLGKHSMNIFLVHSMLRRYVPDLIFSHGHFALCIIMLLALSVAISILIEVFKNIVNYRQFVVWLEMKVGDL